MAELIREFLHLLKQVIFSYCHFCLFVFFPCEDTKRDIHLFTSSCIAPQIELIARCVFVESFRRCIDRVSLPLYR